MALNELSLEQWVEIDTYIQRKVDTEQYDSVAQYFIAGFLDWLTDNDKYIRSDDQITHKQANTMH